MELITFKIISGDYQNITYVDNQKVTFNFNKLNINDIFFINSIFEEGEDVISNTNFKNFLINSKCDFDCTFIGKALKIHPMFSINPIVEYRNICIKMILDEKTLT